MKGRILDENTCLRKLSKIGCEIKGRKINIGGPYKRSIGIKTWGMIDFLTKKGYSFPGFYEGGYYDPFLIERIRKARRVS